LIAVFPIEKNYTYSEFLEKGNDSHWPLKFFGKEFIQLHDSHKIQVNLSDLDSQQK
jgi:hypothetical protein